MHHQAEPELNQIPKTMPDILLLLCIIWVITVPFLYGFYVIIIKGAENKVRPEEHQIV